MSKSSPPSISVIIANFNGEKFLGRCLSSIFTKTKVPYEVIVVDNNSSDGSLKILKKLESGNPLKIIPLKQNVGPALGRNIGVQKSQGKYLVFLDYDTEVGDAWLKKSISYLENHSGIGAGQLKILKLGRNTYDSAGEKLTKFGFLAERARGAKDYGQFDKVEDIFSGKTAAMIVKKSVFWQASGFDPDFFMYWEEPDLCWRIAKLGYRIVFLPMGKIWHAYGTKEKRVGKKRAAWITYQGCRNQVATIIKNAVGLKGLQMLLSVCAAWLLLMLLFAIKLDFKKAAAVLRAFFWIAKNSRLLLKKRSKLKKRLGDRFGYDDQWLPKVEIQQGISWYLGKGINFILGRPF